MGQSIITPPVNTAASITFCCRSLKALCHGAFNKTRSVCVCVWERGVYSYLCLLKIVCAWLIICGHMCVFVCNYPKETVDALIWLWTCDFVDLLCGGGEEKMIQKESSTDFRMLIIQSVAVNRGTTTTTRTMHFVVCTLVIRIHFTWKCVFVFSTQSLKSFLL